MANHARQKVFASIFLDKSSWYANIKMLHIIASKEYFGKHFEQHEMPIMYFDQILENDFWNLVLNY